MSEHSNVTPEACKKELQSILSGKTSPDKQRYMDILNEVIHLNAVIEEKNKKLKNQEELEREKRDLEEEVKKWKNKATRRAGRKPLVNHQALYNYYKEYGQAATMETFRISRSTFYIIKKEGEEREKNSPK